MRKIDIPTGIISTYAGTFTLAHQVGSSFGGDFGPATSAGMSNPGACGVSSNGDVFFTSVADNRVRHIAYATTIITTYVGTGVGTYSGDGGVASAAGMKGAVSIFLDSASQLFVGEVNGFRVRKVSSDGMVVSTYAGTGSATFIGNGGPATSGTLPGAVIMVTGDRLGNVFLGTNMRVHRVDETSKIMEIVAGNDIIFISSL